MKFVCHACSARYYIDDAKVAGKVLQIRCKRCGASITVREPGGPMQAAPVAQRATVASAAIADAEASAEAAGFPSGDAEPAAETWFYSLNGESFGPYGEDELVERYQRGQIGDETYVWRPGYGEWLPAIDVPVFEAAIERGRAMRSARGAPRTQQLDAAQVVASVAAAAAGHAAEAAPAMQPRAHAQTEPAQPTILTTDATTTGAQAVATGPVRRAPPSIPAAVALASRARSTSTGAHDAVGEPPARPRIASAEVPTLEVATLAAPMRVDVETTQPVAAPPRPLEAPETPSAPAPADPTDADPDAALDAAAVAPPETAAVPEAPGIADASSEETDVADATEPADATESADATEPADAATAAAQPPIPDGADPDQGSASHEATADGLSPLAEGSAAASAPTAGEAEAAPADDGENERIEQLRAELRATRAPQPASEEPAPTRPTLRRLQAPGPAAPSLASGARPPVAETSPSANDGVPGSAPVDPSGNNAASDAVAAAPSDDHAQVTPASDAVAAAPSDDDAQVTPASEVGLAAPASEAVASSSDRGPEMDATEAGAAPEQDASPFFTIDTPIVAASEVVRVDAPVSRRSPWVPVAVGAVVIAAVAAAVVLMRPETPAPAPAASAADAASTSSDAGTAATEDAAAELAAAPSRRLPETVRVAVVRSGRVVDNALTEALEAAAAEHSAGAVAGAVSALRFAEEPTVVQSRERSRGTEGAGTQAGPASTTADQGTQGSEPQRVAIGQSARGTQGIYGQLGATGTTAVPTVDPSQRGEEPTTGQAGPSADHFNEGLRNAVQASIQRCHQRQITEEGSMPTQRVQIELTVQPNGRVSSVSVNSTLMDTAFDRCLQGHRERWSFGPFAGDAVTLQKTYVLQ